MAKKQRMNGINFDLGRRDLAENAWLWRHRQPSVEGTARGRRQGTMSQSEAANGLGVSLSQYIKLENGETTLLSINDLARIRWWLDDALNDSDANDAELCFLARKRSGMSVKEVASDLGVSTITTSIMEMKGDFRMIRYWVGRGFHFPRKVLVRPAA
jgi:transcriptional regulator with XRE-family HTH domain